MSIKRFKFVTGTISNGGYNELVEDANGEYVMYDEIKAERDELLAALSLIAQRPKGHWDRDDYSRGYGDCRAEMATVADRALSGWPWPSDEPASVNMAGAGDFP